MPDAETMYLLRHTSEMERLYPGKYVAILGERLVATGDTIAEVYEKTDDLGITDPLVTYIPRADEEFLLI